MPTPKNPPTNNPRILNKIIVTIINARLPNKIPTPEDNSCICLGNQI